jgi:hypothetical protein
VCMSIWCACACARVCVYVHVCVYESEREMQVNYILHIIQRKFFQTLSRGFQEGSNGFITVMQKRLVSSPWKHRQARVQYGQYILH